MSRAIDALRGKTGRTAAAGLALVSLGAVGCASADASQSHPTRTEAGATARSPFTPLGEVVRHPGEFTKPITIEARAQAIRLGPAHETRGGKVFFDRIATSDGPLRLRVDEADQSNLKVVKENGGLARIEGAVRWVRNRFGRREPVFRGSFAHEIPNHGV